MDLIRRFFKFLFQKKAPPFLVASTRAPVAIPDKVVTAFSCPSCLCYWADVDITLGSTITSEDFHVLPEYRERARISVGKPILCPSCGWQYTDWSIKALVLAQLNKDKVGGELSARKMTYGQPD